MAKTAAIDRERKRVFGLIMVCAPGSSAELMPSLSLLAISDGLTPSEFQKYPYMIWIKGKSAEQT